MESCSNGQPAAVFDHRGLKRLLAAQVPADFSDWLDFVAISALLAFAWDAGPIAFAWLAAAMGAPYLLIGPFAGALVDRTDLRRVLIFSNVGRAATTLCLAFVTTVPVLLAIVFLRGTIDAFFSPAKQAAIQTIVPGPHRMRVNGISHSINQASKIVGPSAGGALLLALAPQQVFLVNAAVSLGAAVILVGLQKDLRPAPQDARRQTLLRDIAEAIAEVKGKPPLFIGLALMAAGYFAMFFYDTLIPLLTRAYRFDETTFGLAIAAVGAGGVLGALGAGLRFARRSVFLLIGGGCLISGSIVVVLGVLPPLQMSMPRAGFIALFGVVGVATSLIIVPFNTLVQEKTRPERIARVFSLSESLNVTAMLTAPFVGAAIAGAFSVGIAFVAGGGALMCIGLVAVAIGKPRFSRAR